MENSIFGSKLYKLTDLPQQYNLGVVLTKEKDDEQLASEILGLSQTYNGMPSDGIQAVTFCHLNLMEGESADDAVRRILKDVIVLTRVKSDNLILNFKQYFTHNRVLVGVIRCSSKLIRLDNLLANINSDKYKYLIAENAISLNKLAKNIVFAIDYIHNHDIAHGAVRLDNIFWDIDLNSIILGPLFIGVKSMGEDLINLRNIISNLIQMLPENDKRLAKIMEEVGELNTVRSLLKIMINGLSYIEG